MAVTSTIKINQIECLPSHEGKSNVVRRIYWVYVVQDGEKSAAYGNSTDVELVDGDFTPYEDLTEEQLVQWVEASMTPEQLDGLRQQLLDQITVEVKPLPWKAGQVLPSSGDVAVDG